MPDLGIVTPDEELTIPWYYNVSMAVGNSCANQRLDVKLVQYFLMRLFNHPSLRAKRPAGPALTVDGFYGPITSRYLTRFQLLCTAVKKDGIVDHARANVGSISGLVYTIIALNQNYSDYFGDLAAPWVNDPRMDGELAWAMFAISSQGTAALAA